MPWALLTSALIDDLLMQVTPDPYEDNWCAGVHQASLADHVLDLSCSLRQIPDTPIKFQLRCEGVVEHQLVLGESGGGFELSSTDASLLPYHHPWSSLYFRGTPKSSGALTEDLSNELLVLSGFRFRIRQLGLLTGLPRILETGNGLLHRGPVPILEKMIPVAADHGVEAYMVGTYKDHGFDPALMALQVGDCAVIGKAFYIEVD